MSKEILKKKIQEAEDNLKKLQEDLANFDRPDRSSCGIFVLKFDPDWSERDPRDWVVIKNRHMDRDRLITIDEEHGIGWIEDTKTEETRKAFSGYVKLTDKQTESVYKFIVRLARTGADE